MKISDYFDDFTIHSRIMPVVVAAIPIIAIAILHGIRINGIQENIIYGLFLIAFITILSKICREFGKKYEGKMFKELNGMPTTIVLRFSDNRLDYKTKERYHKKLNEKIDGLDLPLQCNEENKDTDEKYITAINWLRKYANSNRDKEQRVYQELKEYNFWRNLYGIKKLCMIVYALIAIREYIIIQEFSLKQLILMPYPKYMAFIFMILSLVVFILFVNREVVKAKAFDYATTLIEVSDNL